MSAKRNLIGLVIAVLALSLSCGDSGGALFASGNAQLQVRLTDAPSDLIESAVVSISRVILIGELDNSEDDGDPDDASAGSDDDGSDDAGVRIDLLDPTDAPRVYDLMELRDGVQAMLADATIPAGGYHQLRLVVDSAMVTLAEGLTFDDGSTTEELKTPSGMQSGIKVKLSASIDADPDSRTVIVVDFDVNENFVIQGDPDSADGIKGISFRPVLHEIARNSG